MGAWEEDIVSSLRNSLFITFCHFTINLHLIIKVKIRNMVRKPKRNQEAYTRLGFLSKQKHKYSGARRSVRCNTGVGTKTKEGINSC